MIARALDARDVHPVLVHIVDRARRSGVFPGSLTREAFLASPGHPTTDVAFVPRPSGELDHYPELDRVRAHLGAREVRNSVFYPPQSHMGWHTNSDCPGVRRYYSYSEQGGGIFRYRAADGTIVDDIEPPGWVMREFEIPRAGLLWHTIYAPVARWSFGFLLPESIS